MGKPSTGWDTAMQRAGADQRAKDVAMLDDAITLLPATPRWEPVAIAFADMLNELDREGGPFTLTDPQRDWVVRVLGTLNGEREDDDDRLTEGPIPRGYARKPVELRVGPLPLKPPGRR